MLTTRRTIDYVTYNLQHMNKKPKKQIIQKIVSGLQKKNVVLKQQILIQKKYYFFNRMYTVKQHLLRDNNIVKKICENKSKSATSKKDGDPYIFKYIEKDELPENYIKVPLKRWRRFTDEEVNQNSSESLKRWCLKEY